LTVAVLEVEAERQRRRQGIVIERAEAGKEFEDGDREGGYLEARCLRT
jgi:hypothetical protein